MKVTYEYYTAREPFRVKRVRVTGGSLTSYDYTFEYKDWLTVVTDNLSGKKLFYHFNDYGNCVSVNDQLGYACFAKYSDSNPVNHPETISKLQRSVVNLLKNHNFEAASDWTNANLSGTGTYSYATDPLAKPFMNRFPAVWYVLMAGFYQGTFVYSKKFPTKLKHFQ